MRVPPAVPAGLSDSPPSAAFTKKTPNKQGRIVGDSRYHPAY
jgi:hypothetical protein